MSNAKTLMHYFERIAIAAGVRLESDSRAELLDALESQEEQIEQLQEEVRALRRQVPDNR